MEIVGLHIAVAKATSWCGVIGWRNGCCALIGACRCHEIKYLFATKGPTPKITKLMIIIVVLISDLI